MARRRWQLPATAILIRDLTTPMRHHLIRWVVKQSWSALAGEYTGWPIAAGVRNATPAWRRLTRCSELAARRWKSRQLRLAERNDPEEASVTLLQGERASRLDQKSFPYLSAIIPLKHDTVVREVFHAKLRFLVGFEVILRLARNGEREGGISFQGDPYLHVHPHQFILAHELFEVAQSCQLPSWPSSKDDILDRWL